MALTGYRAKRDFTTSPEPPGELSKRRRSPARRFCVQKHLASHLHYDLRLEHDGVLLSWAVPKGPSIDPADKRFAVQVEDHPIEYAAFEGVIPSGYGAGIVMLWDRGPWIPEVEDVGAALARGDLKFRLEGVKLKGSWALVRTGGTNSRNWLLIKHRDDWAGPIDIADVAPLSVTGAGDFADILGHTPPDAWRTAPPARSGAAGAMYAQLMANTEATARPEHPVGAARRAATRGRSKRPASR